MIRCTPAVLALLLAACGSYGGLYLPDEEEPGKAATHQKKEQPKPATAPAPLPAPATQPPASTP